MSRSESIHIDGNPTTASQAAERLETCAKGFDAVSQDSPQWYADDWRGTGATAYTAFLERCRGQLDKVDGRCLKAAVVLRQYAIDLREAQSKADQLRAEVQRLEQQQQQDPDNYYIYQPQIEAKCAEFNALAAQQRQKAQSAAAELRALIDGSWQGLVPEPTSEPEKPTTACYGLDWTVSDTLVAAGGKVDVVTRACLGLEVGTTWKETSSPSDSTYKFEAGASFQAGLHVTEEATSTVGGKTVTDRLDVKIGPGAEAKYTYTEDGTSAAGSLKIGAQPLAGVGAETTVTTPEGSVTGGASVGGASVGARLRFPKDHVGVEGFGVEINDVSVGIDRGKGE